MNYQQTANEFANKYGIEFSSEYIKFARYFHEDKEPRAIFQCILKRNNEEYKFKFGQSIFNGMEDPELYDILACLTKYDPIDLDNFCDEYGFNKNDTLIEARYKRVQDEYDNVNRLFGDIMDELREIY